MADEHLSPPEQTRSSRGSASTSGSRRVEAGASAERRRAVASGACATRSRRRRGWLVFAIPPRSFPLVDDDGRPVPLRRDHADLRAARARAEHRRRLRGPARPRLRRLLRLRRLHRTAILASGHSGHHWPARARDPGRDRRRPRCSALLVGLPSRRLVGDYLAIVTLFFGQAFVDLRQQREPHQLPVLGHDGPDRRRERASTRSTRSSSSAGRSRRRPRATTTSRSAPSSSSSSVALPRQRLADRPRAGARCARTRSRPR